MQSPWIAGDLLDQFLAGIDAASALNSPDWMNAFKKALAERGLNAEMDYHLSDDAEAQKKPQRLRRKTVPTGTGKIDVVVPRNRTGSFDLKLFAKYQRRFPGVR